MSMSSMDRLIHLIYDAAQEPALWGEMLRGVSDAVRGGPANHTDLDIVTGDGWGVAERTDPAVMERYFTFWAAQNPLAVVADADHYSQNWYLGVLRDDEIVDRHWLVGTAYLNEFLRPIEADHSIAIRLSLEDRRVRTIGVGRRERGGRFDDGEIATARLLQPHLIRADHLRRRVYASDTQGAQLGVLMERTVDPLMFVDLAGTVRLTTPAAEELLAGKGPLLRGPHGQLRGRSHDAEARLRALLSAAWRNAADVVAELPSDAGPALRITATPVSGRLLAQLPAGKMVLLDCRWADTPADQALRLRQLYALTPAEARVALDLVAGASLATIARSGGASIHTVRSQLSSIFGKTRCHRQADLVNLLLRDGFGHPRTPRP